MSECLEPYKPTKYEIYVQQEEQVRFLLKNCLAESGLKAPQIRRVLELVDELVHCAILADTEASCEA